MRPATERRPIRTKAASRSPEPVPRPEWPWLLASPLGIVALLWSCRGAMLGVPVADDYVFLHTLAFQHPLDWLGPMGSPFYWRPLSRQLYFVLLGPSMLHLPWLSATLHALVLLALGLTLHRIARRFASPPVAAAIGLFPLIGEPTRVLLGWPSGGEYLLAMLGAALAMHEALAGRLLTSGIAAAAGILSHEAATLALAAMPAIVWLRHRTWRAALPWLALSVALGALSALAHQAARAHGMGLPSDAHHGKIPWSLVPQVLRGTIVAQLNLEDAIPTVRAFFLGAWLSLLGAVALSFARRATRAAFPRFLPALAGGTLWFAAGLFPLIFVLPDWSGWRTMFPGLGLGIVLTGLAGLASPWFAGAVVALRLVALLLAPAALTTIPGIAPKSQSQLSFVRLARLQRTVDSTRRALTTRYSALPDGATVSTVEIPNLTRIGFVDSLAVRVWYRNPTIHWTYFEEGQLEEHVDAMVEYPEGAPARVVELEALETYREGLFAMERRNAAQADSLFLLAREAHPFDDGPVLSSIALNRAICALSLGRYTEAELLRREALRMGRQHANYWAIFAHKRILANDEAGARSALKRCLALDPKHKEGLALLRYLNGQQP